MEAIILAGGLGTRLRTVVSDLPKSMALVNNRPFLEYLLDYLISQKISSVVISVGYKREIIMNHFKDRYKSLEISYAIEEEPLGTGGGIRLSLWKIKGARAFVLNGDSMFKVDYGAMMEQHLKRQADVTLALRKLDNTGRYGSVTLNRNKRIVGFTEKSEFPGPGFINGGVYILEKIVLMEPGFRGKFSIEQDYFEKYYLKSKMYGFPVSGYFLDIGIPEDFQNAQHDFAGFDN
ncbi:MAG: nucleotidyltransferase family protein [Bacteroidales bacterium]|nr:nucleotidyltransferase family protein [Bacteroidales bacterium]